MFHLLLSSCGYGTTKGCMLWMWDLDIYTVHVSLSQAQMHNVDEGLSQIHSAPYGGRAGRITIYPVDVGLGQIQVHSVHGHMHHVDDGQSQIHDARCGELEKATCLACVFGEVNSPM